MIDLSSKIQSTERGRKLMAQVTPTPSKRFSLEFAQKCVDKLMPWFTSIAERVEVCGSVRRKRPNVGDLDFVMIPKNKPILDLFQNVAGMVNTTAVRIVAECATRGWIINKEGEQYISFMSNRVQVDIWFATPETLGSVVMCRTGSVQHNAWLASGALARGGHWHPHQGLTLGGKIHAATEREIYAALGVDFIPPEARDFDFPKIRP